MKNDTETTTILLICLGFFISKLAFSYNNFIGLASSVLFLTLFLQQFEGFSLFGTLKLLYLKIRTKK